MSKLAEYRNLEKKLEEQIAELDSLRKNTELIRDIEFENKLYELMRSYGFGLSQIVSLLDPGSCNRISQTIIKKNNFRKERVLKVYKNPYSGETVATKGGNNTIMKRWKCTYGKNEVESWLIE